MGLLCSQIRLQYLTQMRLDLEYKLQLITQSKLSLMGSANDLLAVGNDMDPESPQAKMLAQRQAKLKILEQKLDLQMQEYQARLQSINTEEQSCRQMMQQNIQRSFSYGGQ
jgi:hypothetical protein